MKGTDRVLRKSKQTETLRTPRHGRESLKMGKSDTSSRENTVNTGIEVENQKCLMFCYGKGGPWTVASESPRSLLEMQKLRTPPD